MKKMSKKTWTILVIVGAVVLGGAFFVMNAQAQKNGEGEYQTAKIERGNLVATVGATGTVRANQTALIVWRAAGTVEQVEVQVGDDVRTGTVLATLSNTSLPQNIILAQADLVNAQRALDDLTSSGTARAQAAIALRDLQEKFESVENYRESLDEPYELEEIVWVSKTIPGRGKVTIPKLKTFEYEEADQESKDKSDESVALAFAQLDDAQRTYNRLASNANFDEIAAAQARVDAAQATLNMAYLTAPFAGTVTQAELMAGDQVSTGSLGFRVDDLSRLLVDVDLSEVDINSVELGQTVTMSFDAVLGQEYVGKVIEVGRVGNNVQGIVNFTITVELVDSDEMVRPGMTAAVNIVVREIEDVILVPNRAVRLVDGERVIYLLKDGVAEMIEIRLGASADTMSVVASDNIAEGDLVILNPPSSFSMAGGPPSGAPGH